MREIQLTKGRIAIVDDADFDWLNSFKWYAAKNKCTWYAQTNVKKEDGKVTTLMMHRVILQLTDSTIKTDHADRNGLNNQRANLRQSDSVQNAANRMSRPRSTSHYLGVSWDKTKWRVQIKEGGVIKTIGRFSDPKKAAAAYNVEAVKVFGQFANLNVIL